MEENQYLIKCIIKYKDRVLLLKKGKDENPENEGKWECPGGRITVSKNTSHKILEKVF